MTEGALGTELFSGLVLYSHSDRSAPHPSHSCETQTWDPRTRSRNDTSQRAGNTCQRLQSLLLMTESDGMSVQMHASVPRLLGFKGMTRLCTPGKAQCGGGGGDLHPLRSERPK
jgi:hypothetical protein